MLADSGTKVDLALFRLEEARALLQLGEHDEAASIAMASAGLLADASPYDAGRGYVVVAEVFEQLGDAEKAREIYELAAELLSPVPSRYLLEVYQKLAALLEADGRKDEALEVLKKAVAVQADAPH
jgi:tetratricopeptide (TPR) repeat protein